MWADAGHGLVFGLREGLAAGLVVSILLAAVRRSRPGSTGTAMRPVWLGVLAALMLSLSFGAVFTFSTIGLSDAPQDAYSGILSVIAVVLFGMTIVWIRGIDVGAKVGAGMLAATAFLAVAREGLTAARFLWSAVHGVGDTAAPLIGVLLGSALAVALCWLLYRWAVRLVVGVFVRRAAIAMIVITGGVLAYGIGELQQARLVAGRDWLAFNLAGGISPDAWWVTIVRGVLNLTPSMTWLQVIGYVLFVGIAVGLFLRGRPAGRTEPRAERPAKERAPVWAAPLLANRWTPVTAVVLVPLLAAGALALFGSGSAPLVRSASAATTVFPRNFAVPPLQPSELALPIRQYQTYVAGQLVTLAAEVTALRTAIGSGDVAASKAAWLPAQLTWERVGAAYDSFGDLAGSIDGGPQGLPDGVNDPGFTGLRRIEYGLWHGQPTSRLAPFATQLVNDVRTLQVKMPGLTEAPLDMTIRVHEILEDAQRDHLSGMSDQGAGTGYAETLADVDGTRVVLSEMQALINERRPGLVQAIESSLDTLQKALEATRHNGVWDNETTGPLAERQRVNAAVGQELETVSPVPDLLEIGAS